MINLVCIVCPNGCRLQVTGQGKDIEVTGAKCSKGKAYAITEMTQPKRSVTTTIKTVFNQARVLPVRTNAEIPKEKIFELMKMLNEFTLTKRIKRGETIISNVFNTGVDVIATSGILYKEE